MSNCIIPNWNNLRHQRQQQEVEGEEGFNRSSTHMQSLNNDHSYSIPMSNYDVTAELTWENGQPAMHGLGDFMSCPQIRPAELKHELESSYIQRSQGLPSISTKPTWINTNDSLESIVHQATYQNQNQNQNQNLNTDFHQHDKNEHIGSSSMAASLGKWTERTGGNARIPPPCPVLGTVLTKRVRSESGPCNNINNNQEEMNAERSSTCASASEKYCCNENDHTTTMMTWPSSESLRSVKTKTIDEDHSACHGGSEKKSRENDTKGETVRSQTTRSSRAAAVHNQSERRRRDRINQKMKALQKLVPNASKTDKASMLDEVISYLKQLQTQIHMMSVRSVPATAAPTPQMMMHPGLLHQQQQQQLQMSQFLARMGMGGVGLAGMGGMGMLDMNNMARSAPHQSLPSGLIHPATMAAASFTAPPPFSVTQIPGRPSVQGNTDAASNSSVPYNNPYFAFLAQSMNMDLYSKMAALFQQQANQPAVQTSSTSSKSNVVKRK